MNRYLFLPRSYLYFLYGFVFIISVSSCSNTKQLADDEALLVKNTVNVESNQKIVKKRNLKENLDDLPIQDPNKKLIGFVRLKLRFFTIANRKRENKFRWWLKNKVGEPPVIYDAELTRRSEDNMRNYLSNRGYFFNEVSSSVIINKKKASLIYHIEPNEVFRLESIVYQSYDKKIQQIVDNNKKASILKSGQPFEIDKLKRERSRISDDLQNQGYFYFNKELITYDLDSSNTEKNIDLKLKIDPPKDTLSHQIYHLDKVLVYSDYSFQQHRKYKDTLQYQGLTIISNDFRISPKVLRDVIFLKKDRLYRKQDYSLTVRRLNALGIFKFVNIRFERKLIDGQYFLDAFVYMTPAKKQSLSIDLEANSNFEGLLGTGISFTYGNKNIFKVADLFTFNITSGVELEFNPDVSLVNTADVSPEVNYYLNRFVLPFRLKNISRNANPKTRFSLGYNFQKRLNFYTLQSFNLSFGYEWNEAANKRHILNPFNISFLNTSDESTEFLNRLNDDPFLKSSFENLLILSGNYSYILTSRNKAAKNYFFFRGNLDIGGNILHGIVSTFKSGSNDEKPYKFLGREYTQYAKTEGDGRYYRKVGKYSSLVLRLNAGLGLSYGNSEVLPYVKQFYAGGANSLRAFDVRSVGPGIYSDTSTNNVFGDQTGDMIIETNAEYRFDIFKWMKGAFFLDAGNVWLIDNKSRPEGNFSSSFYKEFAVGAGAGGRLDFTFFVIRFDWAIPLRDPSRQENDRWVIDKLQLKQFNFNLAIGYPF